VPEATTVAPTLPKRLQRAPWVSQDSIVHPMSLVCAGSIPIGGVARRLELIGMSLSYKCVGLPLSLRATSNNSTEAAKPDAVSQRGRELRGGLQRWYQRLCRQAKLFRNFREFLKLSPPLFGRAINYVVLKQIFCAICRPLPAANWEAPG
jgi:hypothetical protein